MHGSDFLTASTHYVVCTVHNLTVAAIVIGKHAARCFTRKPWYVELSVSLADLPTTYTYLEGTMCRRGIELRHAL